ncbi:PAS domain-containing protein [Streptomyces sp. NPDC002076]
MPSPLTGAASPDGVPAACARPLRHRSDDRIEPADHADECRAGCGGDGGRSSLAREPGCRSGPAVRRSMPPARQARRWSHRPWWPGSGSLPRSPRASRTVQTPPSGTSRWMCRLSTLPASGPPIPPSGSIPRVRCFPPRQRGRTLADCALSTMIRISMTFWPMSAWPPVPSVVDVGSAYCPTRQLFRTPTHLMGTTVMTDLDQPALAQPLDLRKVSDAAIAMIDEHGTVVGWTQAAQRLVDYSAGEVVGQSAAALLASPQDAMQASSFAEQRRGPRHTHLPLVPQPCPAHRVDRAAAKAGLHGRGRQGPVRGGRSWRTSGAPCKGSVPGRSRPPPTGIARARALPSA